MLAYSRRRCGRLEAFLRTLAHEDWQRSSRCDQWTVADVVAHLTAMTSRLRHESCRAYAEIPRHRRKCRRLPGRQPQTLPTMPLRCGSVLATTCCPRFSPRSARSMRPWRPSAQQTGTSRTTLHNSAYRLGGIVDAYITERTIHGWDIQSVFDPHARLSPACLPIVVERNAQRRRWHQAPSDAAPLAPSIRYRFDVTGVPHYRTDVVLTDRQPYMETVGHVPADVTFRCDGETFVLLMYGRIRAHEAVSQGKMTFEGDIESVAAFSQRFQGG